LRIKEQETRLTLHEHDDDEDFDQRGFFPKNQYFQPAGPTRDHLINLHTTDIGSKSLCMNTQVKHISEVGPRVDALPDIAPPSLSANKSL